MLLKKSLLLRQQRPLKSIMARLIFSLTNARAGAIIPIEDTSYEDWKKDLSVDLDGVFLMTREFGKIMIENKYGRIINISSMYGLVGNSELPSAVYHAAKGGVVNFTRAIAGEWAKYGINANSIAPGYFASPLTEATLATESFQAHIEKHVPLKRYAKEEEVASAAVFLSSDEASYVTGAILPVDGGYTAV